MNNKEIEKKRLECINRMVDVPTISIKGKKYSTVSERHRHLLKYFPLSRIHEEIIFHDEKRVIVKTTLYIGDKPCAVGHAEEFRNSSYINKTSALENTSTSSLGRCLAQFGLHGSEFASAEELVNAIKNQGPEIHNKESSKIKIVPIKAKTNGTGKPTEDVNILADQWIEKLTAQAKYSRTQSLFEMGMQPLRKEYEQELHLIATDIVAQARVDNAEAQAKQTITDRRK